MNRALAALALIATITVTVVMSMVGAGATTHSTYALGTAKKCKAGYVKVTTTHREAVKVKVHAKWTVKSETVRYVVCEWRASTGSTVNSNDAVTSSTITIDSVLATDDTLPPGETTTPTTWPLD